MAVARRLCAFCSPALTVRLLLAVTGAMTTSRPARIRVYVDECIHDRLGFTVTAFVFATSDLTESISRLVDAGLIPKRDEFKSGEYMANKQPELFLLP